MVLTLFINRNSKVGQLNETDVRHIVRSNFKINFIKKWSHIWEKFILLYHFLFQILINKQIQIHDTQSKKMHKLILIWRKTWRNFFQKKKIRNLQKLLDKTIMIYLLSTANKFTFYMIKFIIPVWESIWKFESDDVLFSDPGFGYIDRGTAIGPDEFRGIGGPHRSLHLMV